MSLKGKTTKLFHNIKEESEKVTAEGVIPEYVKGTFLRVGPGMWDFPEASMNHFCDGYSILFKFTFDGPHVTFEKKYLESEVYKRALVAKKPVVNEYGTRAFKEPGKSMLSRVITAVIPEMSDNNYSTPFLFKNEVFVGCDTCFYSQIDISSLKTLDTYYTKKSFGCDSVTSHPLEDEEGNLWNLGLSISVPSFKYQIVKTQLSQNSSMSPKELIKKKTESVCSIPTKRNGHGGFAHSFGMTQNYVIFIEQPYYLVMSRVLSKKAIIKNDNMIFLSSVVKGDRIRDWFDWKPEDKNTFHVYSKKSGKLIGVPYVTDKSFFYTHFINCYEEENQIIVDMNIYDSPEVMETMDLDKLRGDCSDLEDHPYSVRFIVPILEKELKEYDEGSNLVKGENRSPTAIRKGAIVELIPEIITEVKGGELPKVNPKYFGKKYKYYYQCGTYNPSYFSHSIVKVNVETKEVLTWKENDFHYPSEPIFIPNPNKGSDPEEEETNGVLIASVVDRRESEKDFVLFLNPKNLQEIGRIYFNISIPCGLHGVFIPSKDK